MKKLIAIILTAASATGYAAPKLNFEGYDCSKYSAQAAGYERQTQEYYNDNSAALESWIPSPYNFHKKVYQMMVEQGEKQRDLAATCEDWQSRNGGVK